jgi:aspartate aminotransferase
MDSSLLSQRARGIQYSANAAASLKAQALKKAGVDVLNLTVGEPGFDTPDYIKQAARQAMEAGKTKYIPAKGILPLRKAVSSKLQRENHVSYNPDEICIANGAKQILFNALAATVNPGDEVIIPAPCWSTLTEMVKFVGGIPHVVFAGVEQQFKITAEQLAQAITPRTKWVLFNSPNNPTGVVYQEAEWQAFARVLRQNPHVLVLIDEIYEHILFTGRPLANLLHIAPDLRERILLVNGVSKTFAMTGWRVGYGAGPQALVDAMTTIQSQTTSGGCSISQHAAVVALTHPTDFVGNARSEYRSRRDLLLHALQETALQVVPPEGGFFVLPNWTAYRGWFTPNGKVLLNDDDFTDYLLSDGGVATIAGSAFAAEGYFRLSIAAETSTIKLAGQRIVDACHRLNASTGG